MRSARWMFKILSFVLLHVVNIFRDLMLYCDAVFFDCCAFVFYDKRGRRCESRGLLAFLSAGF